MYTRMAQLPTLANQQTELSITPTTLLTPNILLPVFRGSYLVGVLKKTDTQVSEERRYRKAADKSQRPTTYIVFSILSRGPDLASHGLLSTPNDEGCVGNRPVRPRTPSHARTSVMQNIPQAFSHWRLHWPASSPTARRIRARRWPR